QQPDAKEHEQGDDDGTHWPRPPIRGLLVWSIARRLAQDLSHGILPKNSAYPTDGRVRTLPHLSRAAPRLRGPSCSACSSPWRGYFPEREASLGRRTGRGRCPTAGRSDTRVLRPRAANITGFHNYEPALGAKSMGIFKQIAPPVRRIAFVHVPEATANVALMRVGEASSAALGMTMSGAGLRR